MENLPTYLLKGLTGDQAQSPAANITWINEPKILIIFYPSM